MINKEIIEAFSTVAREKNLDRTNLGTIIEELFMTLIHKKYGEERENFSVIANMDKGEIEIYQEKLIVEEVTDPVIEISLEEALKVESDLMVGDPFIEVVDPSAFGRRLIHTAKQYLSQKIRDVEKQSVYDEYINQVGDIIMGYIHQVQKDSIFINLDKVELRLPKSEQIENDRYFRGEAIRGIIKSVELTAKGPEIIMSRADNQFLVRLFEMEVPEIEDGIIEIKNVARVPGDRSKIVVFSSDKRIDAVGACVGMRGSRIQTIVRELNGEKIDIISWSDKPEILISRALAPAKPITLYLDEERPQVTAVFEDEELPIAIGRNGQNIKLASEVTNYKIDAVRKSDYEGTKNTVIYLDEIAGISTSQVEQLSDLNIHTSSDFLDIERSELLSIKGFGEKTIDRITDLLMVAENAAEENTIPEEETSK
ncbi:MAG: transcription termination factor NusA [Candidatus Marinimicrobia bacterium]|nr:transcription termination factor NusA [Candidatus Neomarinimicrobiota bacterium]MBL7023493.1 transcription termination factor NusA [Candidatus Neomarinimicrobiota bacterium]MBL7109548.1 transcription termination factor NusA [Candidatus Neomarinimicrobiota bacterium]